MSELAKGLVKAGHQVTVVSTDSSISAPNTVFSGPRFRMVVQHSRPRPRHYLRDFYMVERRAISGILRDVRPDIVHAHWTYEFELAAQDSGLHHVSTARDAPWTIFRHSLDAYRLARFIVAWRARPGIRHLVVASPYMLETWRRQMQYRREVTVIPNMAPSLPMLTVKKSDAPTAICVANAGRLKNVGLLVHAFHGVRAVVPTARLRLVGSGLGEGDALQRRLIAEGLADGIDFIGHIGRETLALQMASAWCLVHPSLEESFGNTLVESMMLGTPVIGGRDSGAVPWVLDYGQAGDLVDVRSQSELGKALLRHLKGVPTAPPARARELLDTRYSREAIVQLHVNEYERVLNVSRGHARSQAGR